jgi:hypothetical protein
MSTVTDGRVRKRTDCCCSAPSMINQKTTRVWKSTDCCCSATSVINHSRLQSFAVCARSVINGSRVRKSTECCYSARSVINNNSLEECGLLLWRYKYGNQWISDCNSGLVIVAVDYCLKQWISDWSSGLQQ